MRSKLIQSNERNLQELVKKRAHEKSSKQIKLNQRNFVQDSNLIATIDISIVILLHLLNKQHPCVQIQYTL